MTERSSLDALPVGGGAFVVAIGPAGLDAHEVEWLRAVGLFEGTHVTLLRRAPMGGPLHLRTHAGAEFAVDRQLARAVAVEVDPADDADADAARARHLRR